MNRKTIYGIVLGIAVSAASAFADEEATALRTELDALNQRLEELEGSAGKSNWTGRIKIKGDFRYRYEYQAEDGDTDDNRHRIRARIGAYADVNDQVKAGVRIASGDKPGSTSTNQTIGDGFNKKELWLDLAYLTYSPKAIDGLGATLGKMKQPWEQVSDLIFDSDVNPEGIALSYVLPLEAVSLMTHLGYHIMEENVLDDVALASGQFAAGIKIAEDIKLTAGLGAFVFDGIAPVEYDIVDTFIKLDINKGPVPVEVYSEYLGNVASGVDNDTAWIVGAGAKFKKFALGYNYRDLEANSVLDALDDGDFGGPGGKGHKIKARYSLLKNWTAGLTYFRVENGGVDTDLLQADLAVKF